MGLEMSPELGGLFQSGGALDAKAGSGSVAES